MSTADVPEWPGLAGWFGLLGALLWLVDPASFRRPVSAVTVALLACLGYGLYRHLLALDRPVPWRTAE